MRISAVETVGPRDPESVISSLVSCLSSAAIAVERYENQLLVRGFGPSELRKNRRDLTVLHVNARNNETVIDAQVLYEGSADLDKRALDRAMRKKLERIFQKVAVEVEPRKEPWKQAKHGSGTKPANKSAQASGGSSGKVAVAVPGRKAIVPPPPEAVTTVPILSAAIARESLVERVRQMASAHLRRKAAQRESFKLEVGAPLRMESNIPAEVKTQAEVGTQTEVGIPAEVGTQAEVNTRTEIDTAATMDAAPAVLLDQSAEPKLNRAMASFGAEKRERRHPQEVTPLSGDAALRLRETSFDGVKDRRGPGRPSERGKQELQLLAGKNLTEAGSGLLEDQPLAERYSRWQGWKDRFALNRSGQSDRLFSPMAVGIGLAIAAVLGTAIYVSRDGTGIAPAKPLAKEKPAAPAPANPLPAKPPAATPDPARAAASPIAATVSPTPSPAPAAVATPPAPAPPNQVAGPAAASSASPAPNAAAAPSATAVANKPSVRPVNLSVWLEQWANAMQGSNAAAQAAFYAGSVDRERKKEMAARTGQWSSTLEDVRIHQTSPTTATVSFTRHDSQHLAAPKANDLFMPEQLSLTMIDGEWKIVSEAENKAGSYSLVNN